ncbi:MAG: hypothetical protein ACE5JG_12380, partial [Planctomycetota bacterium]
MVETFSSLAERVCGRRLRNLMPPAIRDRTAETVLARHFPEGAAHAGLRAEFLAAVKEIKENGVARERALGLARAHFGEGSRGRRLFEAFARYVEEQPGSDHEDLLTAARDRLRMERELLPDRRTWSFDLVFVDGFHDFTGLEREILDLLAGGAAEAVVSLPMDPDDPQAPVFATAARTAAELGIETREALRKNRRAAGPALRHLERRLFGPAGARVPAGSEVERIGCASEEDEADRLARLVAASGRPGRDFLLVRRSFAGLHALYRAAFRRHGVPLRFFGPEPAARTAVARAAALRLRALLGLPRRRDLLPLLRSPFLLHRPGDRTLDAWARRLREAPDDDASDFPEVARACAELEDAGSPLPDLVRRSLGLRDALIGDPHGDEGLALAACLL